MDAVELLKAFFDKASKDARISIGHIGLFVTLLQCQMKQDVEGPLVAYAAEIMEVAKISSTATYHRLIRELNDYGYLRYEPSFFKGVGSKFFLF